MTKKTNSLKGTVHVCAHRVSFWYDLGGLRLTDERRELLEEEAERRAKECITDGYVGGELNCLVNSRNDQREVRGSWEIERD